jgi:glycine hydroxymethyltransferase
MPLWYSSISAEHAAVRNAAGIFDCTHMGVLEISGTGAEHFVDQLTTNSAATLEPGRAQYSFVLEPSGSILDDVIVYRTGSDEFMLVVNAANDAGIKTWIRSLLDGEVCIDPQRPDRKICDKPQFRDLRSAQCRTDCRVDIAVQGPKSLEILSAPAKGKGSELGELRPFQFVQTDILGIECLVSRTGYTGAELGFELFVHPDEAPHLWQIILEAGEPMGALPCGLGSRDSLRIEAGLPLYGHELAGPFDISAFEAGYGWAVKLDKEFFIGKAAIERKSEAAEMTVARIRLPGEKGIRPVRQNDALLDDRDRCIGWVLSSAVIGQTQIALAYADRAYVQDNDTIGLYYTARSDAQIRRGRKQNLEKGELLESDLTGEVMSRFEKF